MKKFAIKTPYGVFKFNNIENLAEFAGLLFIAEEIPYEEMILVDLETGDTFPIKETDFLEFDIEKIESPVKGDQAKA